MIAFCYSIMSINNTVVLDMLNQITGLEKGGERVVRGSKEIGSLARIIVNDMDGTGITAPEEIRAVVHILCKKYGYDGTTNLVDSIIPTRRSSQLTRFLDSKNVIVDQRKEKGQTQNGQKTDIATYVRGGRGIYAGLTNSELRESRANFLSKGLKSTSPKYNREMVKFNYEIGRREKQCAGSAEFVRGSNDSKLEKTVSTPETLKNIGRPQNKTTKHQRTPNIEYDVPIVAKGEFKGYSVNDLKREYDTNPKLRGRTPGQLYQGKGTSQRFYAVVGGLYRKGVIKNINEIISGAQNPSPQVNGSNHRYDYPTALNQAVTNVLAARQAQTYKEMNPESLIAIGLNAYSGLNAEQIQQRDPRYASEASQRGLLDHIVREGMLLEESKPKSSVLVRQKRR